LGARSRSKIANRDSSASQASSNKMSVPQIDQTLNPPTGETLVFLKNGEVLRGFVVNDDGKKVLFKSEGKFFTFQKEEINKVYEVSSGDSTVKRSKPVPENEEPSLWEKMTSLLK
jgi:hypothetical protein